MYDFGKKTDGDARQRELLGGKGANLAEMARIVLPVPPGFTITTEVCTYYYANKKSYPKILDAQIRESVALMEKQLGKKLGDLKKPLLLSVRSGARDSMPGMMDTILNLGLNDETVEALATSSGNGASLGIAIVDSFRCMVMLSWEYKNFPRRITIHLRK